VGRATASQPPWQAASRSGLQGRAGSVVARPNVRNAKQIRGTLAVAARRTTAHGAGATAEPRNICSTWLVACDEPGPTRHGRVPTSPFTTTALPEDTPPVDGTETTGDPSTAPYCPTQSPLRRGADLNGDGCDDLVVSAPYRHPIGAAYVFAGGTGDTFEPTFETTLEGTVDHEIFGAVLDIVGDLDADGFDDLAIANEQTTVLGEDRDEFVSLWFGAPDFTLGDPLELEEDSPGGVFGHGLAGVADADGDGVDDLLIGSLTGFVYTPGRAYLLSGQAGAFDGSVRTELLPLAADAGFGMTTAGAGDVDGDGLSDLLVGMTQFGDFEFDDGFVELFLGGAPFDGGSDQLLTGPFGFGSAMTAVGDWDGDGHDDVVIAAGYTVGGQGAAWLYTGAEDGLDPVPASEHTAEGSFGHAVAACSDIDGDDAPDVVIGGPFSEGTGAGHVAFGGDTADLEPDMILTFPYGHKIGDSVGAFDANADGYGDVVLSGAGIYGDAPDVVLLYFGGPAFDDVPDTTLFAPDRDSEFGFGVIRGFH